MSFCLATVATSPPQPLAKLLVCHRTQGHAEQSGSDEDGEANEDEADSDDDDDDEEEEAAA